VPISFARVGSDGEVCSDQLPERISGTISEDLDDWLVITVITRYF